MKGTDMSLTQGHVIAPTKQFGFDSLLTDALTHSLITHHKSVLVFLICVFDDVASGDKKGEHITRLTKQTP
jgi:hypothetical protein